MSNGRRIPFTQVDAFATRPFTGNPAAVLVLDETLTAEAMQLIASEMNLSETAFTGVGENGERWLRWFTPHVEVPLCGHATLAAAHVLFGSDEAGQIRFSSASGPLTVHKDGARIRLDFPADPPTTARAPDGLLEGLGCGGGATALQARNLWVVRVAAVDALTSLAPRFSALSDVDLRGAVGVSVTAAADEGYDFASRFFAPWVGIDEDPVTGVAHTALAPYWAAELARSTLEARQLSRRGGAMTVTLAGDRVHLSGTAVTVATGEIVVPGD